MLFLPLFHVAHLIVQSRTNKFLFQNFIASDLRSSLTDPPELCVGTTSNASKQRCYSHTFHLGRTRT